MSGTHVRTHFNALAVTLSLFVAALAGARPVLAVPYTFESLANGTLVGQDNWADFGTTTNSHSVATVSPSHIVGSTKVATLSAASGISQSARISDGSYSFTPHLATDTAALIEFDLKSDDGDTDVFALGRALAPLGHPRLGPQFGIWGGLNGFMIRGAVEGAITTSTLTGTDALTDWYRLRLVVDFTANGGNGAGSLYVRNLTDGDLTFRPTPVLSNINLQILNMEAASQNPATWDSMYIRSASTTTQFDNLNPNAILPPVPEPSSVALLAMGLAGMAVVRRRTTRQRVSVSRQSQPDA